MLNSDDKLTTKKPSCSLAALKKKAKKKYQPLLSLFHTDSTEFCLIEFMVNSAITDLSKKHLRKQDSTRFPCPPFPQCHITTILSVAQRRSSYVGEEQYSRETNNDLKTTLSTILYFASNIANYDYARLMWLTIIPLVGASSTAVPILMNLSDLRSNIPLYIEVALIGLAVGSAIAIMCAIPMAICVRQKRKTVRETVAKQLENITLLNPKTQQESSTRGRTSSSGSEVEL